MKQINLKIPETLFMAAENFIKHYGFRNLQDLALQSMREKIFEDNEYDESFTKKEIDLIEKLIKVSTEKNLFGTEKELIEALK